MQPDEILSLRLARGETQAEFGAAVGAALGRAPFSQETVSRWESGRPSSVPWRVVVPLLTPADAA